MKGTNNFQLDKFQLKLSLYFIITFRENLVIHKETFHIISTPMAVNENLMNDLRYAYIFINFQF